VCGWGKSGDGRTGGGGFGGCGGRCPPGRCLGGRRGYHYLYQEARLHQPISFLLFAAMKGSRGEVGCIVWRGGGVGNTVL